MEEAIRRRMSGGSTLDQLTNAIWDDRNGNDAEWTREAAQLWFSVPDKLAGGPNV